MNEFEQRLADAIARGENRRKAKEAAERQKAMSEEEIRRLHSKYRLDLSEYIEHCLKRIPDFLPGFKYEAISGDRGWGGAVARDDVSLQRAAGRRSEYSRLEIAVRPLGTYPGVDLVGKGIVRNKEVFDRNFYRTLVEVDVPSYRELIDRWSFEFAEMYSQSR